MKNISISHRLFAIASLAWMLAVSLAYVYTHKAFSPETIIALLQATWQVALSIVAISLSASLGAKLRKFLDAGFAISYLVLGMGLLSLGILVVGVWIGTHIWVFALASILLMIWLWRDVIYFWKTLFKEWSVLRPESSFARLIAFISGMILLLNFSVALAPPLGFDALVYHLTLPLRYIQDGQITYIADSMFWGMPQLAEMQYLFMLLLGGESAPALLGWMIGLIALLSLGAYAAQRFGALAGWVAVAALLSGFTLSKLLGQAYIEWFLILYGLAWWILLEKTAHQPGERKWLVLLAIVSGFALSLKYTSGILPLLVVVFLLFQKRPWLLRFQDAFLFGALVTLTSLPWWIKNLAWTGNPFYPLLFAAAEMDAIRIQAYNSLPSDLSLVNALSFPWYITIWGSDGKLGPSASIGPLLLILAPFAAWGWKEKNTEQQTGLRLAGLVLLLGFLIWIFVGSRNGLLLQTRLFVTLFPVWAFLAAAGFQGIASVRLASVRLGRITLAIVIMFLIFNLLETITDVLPKRSLEANFGLLGRENYLARNLAGLHSVNQAIADLPPGSKVLFLWETRSFYCTPACDPDEIIDHWYHQARLYPGVRDMLDGWLAGGYTHVLIWESGYEFVYNFDSAKYNQRDWQMLNELRQLLGPAQTIESYTLYPLNTP